MVKLSVMNIDGKEAENIELPDNLFGEKVNKHVLYQAVIKYQASQRQGNASTRERGSTRGGGKKPFRQKGTGRARAGSTRSPLFRGGGVTFGPVPKDYGYEIPKKVKKAALRESINLKLKAQDILCIDDLKQQFTKTKDFFTLLQTWALRGKVLAVLDGSDESIARVSRNIPRFNLMRACDVNAYDILRNKKLLVTKTAMKYLMERVEK